LKSSPDVKIESDKIKPIVAAKKLLFEDNEAAENSPMYAHETMKMPSYRILARRREKNCI